MRCKHRFLTHSTILFLLGTTTSTFAMQWPKADEEVAESSKQGVIQQQLKELEPLGVKLEKEVQISWSSYREDELPSLFSSRCFEFSEDTFEEKFNITIAEAKEMRACMKISPPTLTNILVIPLREESTALGIALSQSSDLLATYDVHLEYCTPFSADHFPLMKCLKRLVSLAVWSDQTLNIERGKFLSKVFTQHPTLTHLYFSGMHDGHSLRFTDDGLITIQQSLSALPHLRILNLEHQYTLGERGFATLANILGNLVCLEDLNLSSMGIKERENEVSATFSRLTNLKRLNLSENDLVGDFFSYLKNLTNLTELNVSRERHRRGRRGETARVITGDKLRVLTKSKLKESLKIVNFSHNAIGDEGAFHLSMLPHLTFLNISDNCITDAGITELIDLQDLEYLDISHNSISEKTFISFVKGTKIKAIRPYTDYSFGYIKLLRNEFTGTSITLPIDIGPLGAQILASVPTLTSLDCWGSNIGYEGAQFLAQSSTLACLKLKSSEIGDNGSQALAKAPALTELDLESNGITAIGAQALFQNTNLKKLNLSRNKIGECGDDMYRAVYILAHNATLRSLNLSSNGIDNFGGVGFHFLIQNATLTEFDLHFNNINDKSIQNLAKNTTIKKLNLSYNQIGNVGAQSLAQNTTLTSLNLSSNKIVEVDSRYLFARSFFAQGLTSAKRNYEEDQSNNDGHQWAEYFVQNNNLTELDLSSNQIGDIAIPILAHNTTLVKLELWPTTDFGEVSKNALIHSVNENIRKRYSYLLK